MIDPDGQVSNLSGWGLKDSDGWVLVTEDVQLDRYSDGQSTTWRAVHKPSGLVTKSPIKIAALVELNTRVADARTTVTVTTTYDHRSVPATVEPAYRFELDGGALNVTRAIAIYRRTGGEPWELGLVRLTGRDDAGTEDQAILIESPDWPEWLTRFVADNLPKD